MKKLAAAFLALTMIVAMFACTAKKEPEPVAEPTIEEPATATTPPADTTPSNNDSGFSSSVIGRWTAEDTNGALAIEFKSDGIVIGYIEGKAREGTTTYSVSGTEITITPPDGKTEVMIIEGNTIISEGGGLKIVYIKD
ncbi:MAG: hypothetical protein LBN00_09615 [Oscillospiraceae bacterium]|jgi:hypothetical protein|nr:hypothetical protein [Oscillospiraceae bacterium]